MIWKQWQLLFFMLRPFTFNCCLLYSEGGLLYVSELQCMRNLDQYGIYDAGKLPNYPSLRTSKQQNTFSRDMIYFVFFLPVTTQHHMGNCLLVLSLKLKNSAPPSSKIIWPWHYYHSTLLSWKSIVSFFTLLTNWKKSILLTNIADLGFFKITKSWSKYQLC